MKNTITISLEEYNSLKDQAKHNSESEKYKLEVEKEMQTWDIKNFDKGTPSHLISDARIWEQMWRDNPKEMADICCK